ncbi:hypothetical protein [Limosilactobacillus oris]|uniref:hypothetical protein n=1 Tax=Limosilactobacillus oris TaxID=1632 RepID=UPI00195D84D6|nr:hypothetical protein [Limosilactobacillus oris]VTX69785.1 Uncharacterised protein [Limosilactobacillus oris]
MSKHNAKEKRTLNLKALLSEAEKLSLVIGRRMTNNSFDDYWFISDKGGHELWAISKRGNIRIGADYSYLKHLSRKNVLQANLLSQEIAAYVKKKSA